MKRTPFLLIVLQVGFLPLLAAPARAERPSPDAVVAVLGELRTELEWPGLTVAQAAANLKTPPEALRFVRDEIVLVNYRGAYAGAEGALRTRVANATDKSLLLAALLKQMSIPARLVRSAWPAGARPHQGPGPRRNLPALKKLQGMLGAGAPKAGAIPADVSDKQLQELQDEVNTSARVIEDLLAAKGQAARLKGVADPRAAEPTRTDVDWVWVQGQLDGKTWTDLDPVFPHQRRPETDAAPFAPKPVTMSVYLVGGRTGQKMGVVLLEWTGPCQQVLGHDLLLSYFPDDKDLKAPDQPEKVEQWKPFLSCGPLHVLGKAFSPAGRPPKAAAVPPKPAGGFGGFGGLGGSPKPAPKAAAAAFDFLVLMIRFNDPGGPRPWSASFSRVVQYTGKGYDAHELIAIHRIGMGMAFVPVRVVESRMVDEVIHVHRLRRLAETGEPMKDASSRGYSTRTTRILNTLLFLKMLAAPASVELGWKGPALFVETYQLRKEKEQLYFASRLDTLHEAFGPGANQSRRQRALWGLATSAVEAHLMKGRSVNQHLLAARKGLRIVAEAGTGTRGQVDAEAIQRSVLAGGGIVLASADAPGSLWALRRTGDLLGMHVDLRSGVPAKGAGNQSRSEAAGDLFGAVAEGAMSMLGAPSGMLIAPLSEYFKELAKAYIKAAKVLDNLAKTIETGDDSHMNKDQDNYFQNLGRHLTNALTRGFIRGWAEAAAGAGIGHALGTSGSRRIVDRIIDGLVATGLSLPEESPVFPTLMREVMDAVTLPTE